MSRASIFNPTIIIGDVYLFYINNSYLSTGILLSGSCLFKCVPLPGQTLQFSLHCYSSVYQL